jgi:hypothetical protein
MSLSTVGSAEQHGLGPVVVTRMELSPPPVSRSMGAVYLLTIGLALSGFGVFMAVNRLPGPSMPFVALGLPLIALGGFFLARRAALRCGFTLHEQGFVISRKKADSVIPFSEVREFSLTEEEWISNGEHAGILRLMDFTWADGKTRVTQFTRAKTQDAFGSVLNQLIRKLSDAAEARIEVGQALRGKGWTLGAQGLTVDGRGTVRLSELARVGLFENNISFWRVGEERPFFSIAEDSPNALLLRKLARRQHSNHEQPVASSPGLGEQPLAGPLGRLLFQRMSPTTQAVCRAVAGLTFLTGIMAGITRADSGGLPMLGILWGISAMLVLGSLREFRVYERGVSQKFFRRHTLLYSELTSFQFGAVRKYRNGTYVGTTVAMRFTPGPGGKLLTHVHTSRGNDTDLNGLRERVAKIIANHLLERLQRGEDIQWGPSALFTQQGLVIRASRLAKEQRVPYDAGVRCKIKEGNLYLFIGEEHLFIGHDTAAALVMPCAVDNFYPGLKMLEALCSHAEEALQASV